MSGWISVDERLPESDLHVLVTDGNLMVVAEYVPYEFIPVNVDSYDFTDLSFDPTHWQPLPEPPK